MPAPKKRKNGGKQPTMQPENKPVTPEKPELTEADLEALDALAGKLEDATACEPEIAGEDTLDEARAQTLQAETAEALAAANARADEYLNLAQRVQADFDNYRRRNQNVRGEAFEEGARALVATLLPVLDNLERATSAAADSPEQSLREGVEMVLRQLNDAFAKRGVTAIARAGEKFDPNLENAVMQGTPEDGEPGTVCEVLQKGYQMGGFVLRHAMVKVVPD